MIKDVIIHDLEAPMANPEHLEILKRGVEAWNKWRKDNPEVLADLFQANLQSTDLYGANLGEADLRRANLRGADLLGADLGRADLRGANLLASDIGEGNLRRANLRGADLGEANLGAADLYGADLGGANLSKAYLDWANLRAADLHDADLSQSFLNGTIFGNNDLSTVRGLETVTHRGPSTIGIDSIYQSKASIPEKFLRGAGVPEDFIVYMRSLAAKPIEFYSCFISYSSKDQEFTERLYADLQSEGVRCWFAPEDLKIGDKFRTRIDESIRSYDKLMVVLSENSIRSPWVEEEIEAALEKERQQNKLVLFPLRLNDAVMQTQQAWAASLRRMRHIGEFSNWKDHDSYRKALERLLRDLKAEKTEDKTA
jgi:hypothetical protein